MNRWIVGQGIKLSLLGFESLCILEALNGNDVRAFCQLLHSFEEEAEANGGIKLLNLLNRLD